MQTGALIALLLASCASTTTFATTNNGTNSTRPQLTATSQPGYKFNASSIPPPINITDAHHIPGSKFDKHGHVLPKAINGTTVDPAIYMNTTQYQMCLNSSDCEPYHHARGWRAMPSESWIARNATFNTSNSSSIQARQSCSAYPGTLQPTYGSNTMFYGNQNPTTAAAYSYYICYEYGCDNVAAYLGSQYLGQVAWVGQVLEPMTIETYASGWYQGYEVRAALINAIEGMASQNQYWYQDWYWGGYSEDSVWFGQGNNYWQVCLVSDGCGSYLGCLEVWTAAEYGPTGGNCGDAGIITSAMWDFLNMLGPIGGIIAAIAGIACS
ncbi:hypothetical protein N7486_008897 [Penicillium sp. IBT 16267x]|nr:hypothetical protein N7486_008897 [Penicillium sp. IBT 16267x]